MKLDMYLTKNPGTLWDYFIHNISIKIPTTLTQCLSDVLNEVECPDDS